MDNLESYFRHVEDAVLQKDGLALRSLVRGPSKLLSDAITDFVQLNVENPFRIDDPIWDCLPEVIEKCFASFCAISDEQWVDAFDHVSAALDKYLNALSKDTAWSLPLFHQLCEDVRIIAKVADEQLRDDRRKPSKLEAAERILKKGFTIVNSDRRPVEEGSRRVGALGCITQLFKVYFRLNNLGLCVNLTRTVSHRTFPDFELFPMQHRATYKYYTGRLLLYDDKYAEAAEALTYALSLVPKSFHIHRRRVLFYLIPAKILTGSVPSRRTLEIYDMKWYKDIAEAIRTGNVGQFEQAVTEHEGFLIETSLYLSVEKMKALVYLSLVKQVTRLSGNQNKIPLDDIIVSLRASNVDVERTEVECVLSNLIHKNLIKGYISHKVGFLVLSKKMAFPPVTSL